LPPNIPKDQLERIEPIVDAVLGELRLRTRDLLPEEEPALVYRLDDHRLDEQDEP